MKPTKFQLFLLIVAAVFVLSSLVSASIFASIDWQQHTRQITLDEHHSFSPINVTHMNIETTGADIFVVETTESNLTVDYIGECTYRAFETSAKKQTEVKEPKPIIKIDQDALHVKIEHPSFDWRRFTTHCEGTIKVAVPAQPARRLDIKSVSSDVSISIPLEKVKIDMVSGDIITTARAASLDITTVSSDILIVQSDHVVIDSTSGDITIEDMVAADITTVSGDVRLHLDKEQTITVETVSGDISGKANVMADSPIRIETVSGDIHIRRKEN